MVHLDNDQLKKKKNVIYFLFFYFFGDQFWGDHSSGGIHPTGASIRGAIDHRINPSWWTIKLILIPTHAPQLV